jgi:hypothetical protein
MPSWSASNPPENATTTSSASAVERARRLLEQLFTPRPRAEQQPPTKR